MESWTNLLLNRHLGIDHVLLQAPEIIRYKQEGASLRIVSEAKDSSLKIFFTEFIYHFNLDSISIQNASLLQITVGEDSTENFAVNNIHFSLSNLSVADVGGQRRFEMPEFNWDMEDVHVRLSKTVDASIGKVKVKKDRLYLSEISVKDKRSALKFIKNQKWRKAHMEMTADSVSVNISSLLEYFVTDQLHIPSLSISGLTLQLSVNPNKDFENPDRPLISSVIRRIKTLIAIDTIQILNASVELNVLIKEDREPGRLALDKMNITVLNFTNDLVKTEQNPWMTANIIARNQKQGLIDMQAGFNLKNRKDEFYANGKMSAMDFAKFNSMTQKPIDLSFEKGYLHMISFQITGNKDSASGIVHFDYEDLHVVLNDGGEQEDQSKGFLLKKMITGLANGIVKTSNRADEKNYKYAKVQTAKPMNKGHFGFIMDVVTEGVLQITTRRGELSDNSPKSRRREKRQEKKQDN